MAANEQQIVIAVLGSTGSVGTQVLNVARRHPQRIRVAALVAGSNRDLLARQIAEFRPDFAGLSEVAKPDDLAAQFPGTRVVGGERALTEAAVLENVDTVVVAASGLCALPATLAAVEQGKRVALASKEILVGAGHLVMPRVRAGGAELLPVDSEHSAVFQCLQGRANPPRRVILTASGGAYRDRTAEEMKSLRAADALRHPTWNMGPKITVDCATLVNKGLELIEAKWLFGLAPEQVDAVIHPQSVVHSLVEFADGAMLAQLGAASMELPIAYALFYPERVDCGLEPLNLSELGELTFRPVDEERFPAFALAKDCLRRGGFAPLVYLAADEVAVEAFLQERIGFPALYRVIERAVAHFAFPFDEELGSIAAIDAEVKAYCRHYLETEMIG